MPVSFTGMPSVVDRTVFTNRGPIVKKPLDILTGSDLRVLSETDVIIPSGSFTSSVEGKILVISGSAGGRNDGSFMIGSSVSSTRLSLRNASFDISDVAATTATVVAVANDLRDKLNLHRTRTGVHGTNDLVNVVSSPLASDLTSAIVLLNDIRAKFNAHVVSVSGSPGIHRVSDADAIVASQEAGNLPSAVILAEELKRRYEYHRLARRPHVIPDTLDVVAVPDAKAVTGVYPGPLVGPLTWTLRDPRVGQIADDPTDVSVLVNGNPTSVEAVFGVIGAIVLAVKPMSGDVVTVDYDFLNNPPARFLRLNDHGLQLNQAGNRGVGGYPGHSYRIRSHLVNPEVSSPDLISPRSPRRVGWKYKALERAYTASLNDPSTLLLNVPTNRLTYPVLFQEFPEVTVRYDPTSLPQNSVDPWTLEGAGTFTLAPGGSELTVVDLDASTGQNSRPPFFTHALDLRAPSTVSAAFRSKVVQSSDDGVFTGVSFGLSDGQRVCLAGFILTDATNLSSAITMANDLRTMWSNHLVEPTVHSPDDSSSAVSVVPATNLTSLVILLNDLRTRYESHRVKGGAGGVHMAADVTNVVSAPAAFDLASSVVLVNQLRSLFNAHRMEAGVHFVSDGVNSVDQVRQVGILTNRGYPEFQDSWETFSSDWRDYKTYRISRDPNGDVSLYFSGDLTPSITVQASYLPAISDLDGKFDPLQQVFFGPTGRESTSTSSWQFVRTNVAPVDANLIGDNKMVEYSASYIPELDPSAPWITLGQEGCERVITSGTLLLDSTAVAVPSAVPAMGASSNAFRGFTRFEPVLSESTAAAVEFSVSGDWWTHGLDNRSSCLVIDDGDLTVQFCLLQYSPSAAVVTGSTSEPFPTVNGDDMTLSFGSGPAVTVTFSSADSTAALIASAINSALGQVVASASAGKVMVTSPDLGTSAKLTIFGGSILQKVGFSPGQYFGKDSNPEPKVSWFGSDLPDRENPAWSSGGQQPVTMLGRVMRIEDLSVSDYRVYSQSDPVVTNQTINPLTDWKLDFRIRVASFQALGTVPVLPPFLSLEFAGATVVVDEGPSGKNVELQLAVDGSGNQYLNLVSYNPATGSLDVKAQYSFAWNDGRFHSFNVYTSKLANSVFIHADGVQLSPLSLVPSYFALNQGSSGPSITFGSGGEPVTGVDLRTTRSVVDWDSVAVMRDSKLSDPSSGLRRYVGLFKGGDPSVLASYYLHQVDWAAPHVYRIVRDPVSGVQVFVDSSSVPAISVAYDALSLPPANTSFLKEATSGRQAVAFGSFNPSEMSRTRWGAIRYSMGKLTLTDRLIPPHQTLNQANVIASSEHLRTTKPHQHFGFKVYSGGTPWDDFMADQTISAVTELGEGTPPVPMTQDLDSRGGMVRIVTPVKDVPTSDFVDVRGFISDLEDDSYNPLSLRPFLSSLVSLANDVRARYEAHRVLTPAHAIADAVNAVVPGPCTDLASAIGLLNDIRTRYGAHRVQAAVHVSNDTVNVVTAPAATDATSAYVLANDLLEVFSLHQAYAGPHLAADAVNVVSVIDASDILTLIDLIELPAGIRYSYNAHRVGPVFHSVLDEVNSALSPEVIGLPSAIVFLNDCKRRFNTHLSQAGVHLSPDETYAVTAADASDLPTAITLANQIKSRFNLHRVLTHPHAAVDPGTVVAVAVSDPTQGSIDVANDIRAKYLLHASQPRVHVSSDDENVVLAAEATDLASAIVLANSEKSQVNLHLDAVVREVQKVHTVDDTVNQVTASDASDLPTLLVLLDDVWGRYEAHRVQPGVHGSSVFIRLDPPSRVLYEKMKFWKTETGDTGLVSPFSDDETWHIDAIKSTKPQTLSLHGGATPDRAQLVGANAEPFSVVDGDTLMIQVDATNNPVVTVTLAAGDTTLANVISRINGTAGLPATIASSNGDGKLRLTSQTGSSESAVRVVGGTAVVKLGLDVPQHTPWFIVSDDPSAVSVTLGTSGPTDYVRYQTTGSTKTRYQSNSGLPDVPSDLTVTLKIRINSVYSAAPDFDSNIYVGVSGIAGPGFSVGIGFDQLSGVKFVKLQDLNSGTTLFRKPFDWLDGNFHTYVLTRDTRSGTLRLAVS